MRWMVIGFLLVVPALVAGENGRWYDWQGKPVEVSATVAEQRTEAGWVPGWQVRERERQAAMGRKRCSRDRGWHGYGWAEGGGWFRCGWSRYSSYRMYRGSGYGSFGAFRSSMRHGAMPRHHIRVNTPGLRVNWCR